MLHSRVGQTALLAECACGSSFLPPNNIHDMNLLRIGNRLDCLLQTMCVVLGILSDSSTRLSNRCSFSLKCVKKLLYCPFPCVSKPEAGDVGGELNNFMLSHLRLGVVFMELCEKSLSIIFMFLDKFIFHFLFQFVGLLPERST